MYYNSTGGRMACGGGKYSAEGATSCSNITAGCYGTSASSSCPAVCAANTYSNAGASACTACDSDYANSGDTAESHAGVASCKVTCAAGTYVASSGAACTDVGNGYYTTESQTISQGSTGSRSACNSLNAFYTASDSGRNATTDCFGTTTSGKFVKTAKSGEETCTAGGYCAGSVKVYYNSTGGRTGCGAGKYNASTGSSSSSACANITAGCYGTSASSACPAVCATNTYSDAGASACTACDSDYANSGNTAESHAGVASCKVTCAAGTYVASSGAACTDVGNGYYTTESQTISQGSTGSRSACNSLNAFYTASDSGRNATTDCFGTTTSGKFVKTAKSGEETCTAGGYCAGSVKVYYNSTGGRTACGAGTANANTGSSASSACTACAAGTYNTTTGNTTCSSCPAGSYCTGGSNKSACVAPYSSSAEGSDDTNDCYLTTSSTKYVAEVGKGEVTCAAGGYCPGGSTIYRGGTVTGRVTTGGRTGCGAGKYNASTGSSSSSACANITAGCYGTSASSSCPAVCAANKWSAAGASSCTSCPTDYENSGDTSASHANQSSCKITVYGGYYIGTAGDNSSNWDKCSAGYYKAAHSVAYGSTSSCSECGAVDKYSAAGASACSTVSTGYYTTGGTTTTRTGQSQCTSGTYCTDGVQNTCPSGYGASAAGSDAAADCYMSVAATKYVKAANDSSASACGTGTYKAAHTVYYGGTSTCSPCPSGYDDGAAVATQAECVISVAGGKYVGVANSATLSTCAGGTYKAAHSVAYGSTSSCGQCPVNSYCPEGASAATACSTLASGFYPNSAAGSDAAADCYTNSISGKYVASKNATSATNCAGGTYKGSHQVNYGSTSSCGTCPENSYCPAGASAATACSTLASGFYPNSAAGSDAATDCKTNSLSGKYVASKNATSATNCAAGTFRGAHIVNYGSTSSCDACALGSYSAAGASACTACQSGKTTSGTGKSSCDANCVNNNSYDSTWATATWSNNAVANLCQIATCAGGSRYTSVNGEAAGTLPSGYTQLAYLESTGTQYLLSPYRVNNKTVFYCRYNQVGKGPEVADAIFGVTDEPSVSNANNGILRLVGSSFNRMGWGNTTYNSIKNVSAPKVLNTWYEVLYDQNKLYQDGTLAMTSATLNDTVWSANYDLGIFARNGQSVTMKTVAKISSVWAKEDGEYVLNLVPAKRNSDGVLGMYDTVNNRFLVNAGSGTFVAGPAILKSQNTCTQCSAGTYSAGGTATSCGQCPANSYCPAGASAATACSTLASGFYPNSAAGSGAATDCKTNSLSGKYVASANATSATTCSCGTYKAAHTVAYGSTSSCTTTSAGYYAAEGASSQTQADAGYYAAAGACDQTVLNNGCYGSAGASTACPNNCNALTAPAVTGGTFSSVTPRSANTACRYVAPSKTDAECTSITANTVSYSGTAWGTNFYTAKANKGSYVSATGNTAAPACTTCSKGYYQASDNSTAASCTPADKGYYVDTTGASAQKQCTAGTYTSSTAQSSCSTITSGCWGAAGATSACPNNCNALTAPAVTGGTFSSVTPRSANTACRYVAPSKTDAECTSITANTVSYSGTAWGTNFYTAKANKGSYVSATGNTAAPACTTCSKGYYQASDNSTAASCTPADKGYYVDTTGASAQKQCTAGTYTSSTAQSSCSTITSGCWGAAGATSACPNNCNALTAPAVTGGTFSSVTPRNANTACRYVAPSKTYTGCSSITANTVSYSGTAWGTDFYTTKASKGYRVTATGNTSAPACTACACGTYQGTDDSTTTTCTTTSAGYYAKGTGNSSQTQASAGYYAAAGACDQTKIQAGCFGGEGSASACPNSCPAAESGWTLASTTGLKVVTDCAEITTPSTSGSPIATICTAGTLTKKATNSTTWGSATASGLTAKAGRYVNGTTCSACSAGTYTSSATTKTSCTPAAAGYYVSGTEATSQTACPAGTYGSTTGLTSSACSGKCTAGYYCPAASTSATQNECTAGNYCPAGAGAETSCATVGGKLYVNSAAKSDAATDCYISLASKVYLASATSTSTTTCTAGYYCPGGNFYYSSSATNQGRSSCTGTTYSGSGAASCSDCPSGYTANTSNNKTAASQCQISCAAGTQVATANAQCTTPSGNWYTTASQLVNYGSTSSVNACKVATNLFNPSDYDSLWGFITSSRTTVAAYDVNAIVWVPVEPNTTYIVSGMRGANTMTVANSASVPAIGVEFSNFVDPGSVGKGMLYTTSSNAKYLILQGLRDADRATTSTRQSVLDKNVANLQIFKASDGYGIIGNETTDHDTAEDCKITCGPGQYVATENSACVNVGAGYYAAGGSVSYGSTSTNRSQCASGLTTIGYGTGANEAADCGRKLHAGDNVIYLRSAERTSPSLRVKVGDKTFFGALSTALSGALKVKNGSTTYSVVNDYQ